MFSNEMQLLIYIKIIFFVKREGMKIYFFVQLIVAIKREEGTVIKKGPNGSFQKHRQELKKQAPPCMRRVK